MNKAIYMETAPAIVHDRRRVLAIDPGSEQSAYVHWDGTRILSACILTNYEMLQMLRMGPKDVPVVIEMIASYGMPVGKEVFGTCVWIGRFCEAISREGFLANLEYRQPVKLHHCHSAKAKDSNVIAALRDRFGDKGTKANPGICYGLKKDMWQAFALAVYWYDTQIQEESV